MIDIMDRGTTIDDSIASKIARLERRYTKSKNQEFRCKKSFERTQKLMTNRAKKRRIGCWKLKHDTIIFKKGPRN